jgi:diguanylate cyclase (GGDEF)-like protein
MLDNNWPVFVMAVIIGLLLVTILIVAMADRRIDASQEHEANALQRVARRDDLTGLANRLYMRERLGSAISSTSEMFSFALLYLDLDRFKPVNDQFGHQVGDALLIAVSERIRQSLNPLDIAARFGGDEFIVLQDIGGILSEASALADQLIASLSRDFLIDGHRISISASG